MSRVIVAVMITVAGAMLLAALFSQTESLKLRSATPTPVIQIVTRVTIATETPMTGPMATTRPTVPPYQTSVPTHWPTTFPMENDQSGDVRTQ